MPEDNILSNKMQKSMNIDSKTNIAQAYLIGQLSRSADAPKGLGQYLLEIAFQKLNVARDVVGCRLARVDCIDALVSYYEAQGFKRITKNADGDLNQLVAIVSIRPDSYTGGESPLET